jgi:hypothetical protein
LIKYKNEFDVSLFMLEVRNGSVISFRFSWKAKTGIINMMYPDKPQLQVIRVKI